MPAPRAPRPARLGVGQLLARLLWSFREEMLVADDGGSDGIRPPHLHVLANMQKDGVRLTTVAARCQLSLATTSALVTELQALGYLGRRPDPADGRAKLIVFTPKGRRLFTEAADAVAAIEQRWSDLVGDRQFDDTMAVLQDLVDQLTGNGPPSADRNDHRRPTT